MRYDKSGHLLSSLVVIEGIGSLTSGGNAVWVVKDDTNKVARLEPGANVLVDWATMPDQVRTMRYAGGKLWVTLRNQDAIARVDARHPGRFVTAAAGHSPSQAVLAGGRLFVTSQNDQTALVLDPETLEEKAPPIHVGLNPYGMVADDRSIWVTSLGDNSLTRIDYR